MTESVASTREFEGLQIPAAGTYELDAAHKRVGFVVRHLMVSKVRGNFAEADRHHHHRRGPAAVLRQRDDRRPPASRPASADRDNHLRTGDFFEAEKYPTMTSAAPASSRTRAPSSSSTASSPSRTSPSRSSWSSSSRAPPPARTGRQVFGFSATTEIDREDWGLTYNMALESGGVMIGKKVKIEIEGEAIRQA